MTNGAHRKVVTVLFCDVVGSTALGESVDPEALQGLLVRYFERMTGIVESHGGSVEKFIGDAVMAVFGVPALHEDDALRACRAAVEMREALPELGLEGRIGLNSGEVLTGTEERLATGDAVNVAARLEQAAEPGEVLIGQPTLALVGDGVEVEPLEPLQLKGKAEPVPVYRLLRVHPDGLERRREERFVGRERELLLVREVWGRVRAEQRCELLTVVGDAGVGKSRLVAEFLGSVEATVVRGRCLPYGEGITYWPVVEVLKQLEVVASDEAGALAIGSLLGESEGATSAEEIAWAFRKTLEQAAAERPLVVVFDDIQWGEETLRDLIEHVALLSSGAAVLLLCMARPELAERHPAWPVTLRLEPLAGDEVEELIAERAPGPLRDRIARAAGGNPLFIEEMLAMAGEADGEVVVPPTLRALLAARLDQLEPAERSVLERGAVEGEVFHRDAVQALAPEETQVTPRLAALVRKRLIRSDRALLAGEDAFRFRHLLIRDAAYDALPKATRADLHRRFAAWLEQHGESLVELDEILGYHLEQASRYLDELGRPDQEVALAAGDRLALAGKRAWRRRGDASAAASLLGRALALTRPHRFDVHLEIELAGMLYGSDLPRAVETANAAVARAEAAKDRVATALARTEAAKMRLLAGHGSTDETERLAHEALPLLEAADDDEGLVYVWEALGQVANWRLRLEDWAKAAEQTIAHARADGPDNRVFGLGVALLNGPRPAGRALEALDAVLPEQPTTFSLLLRARMLAMLDRIDEAWAVALAANERARELGIPGDDDLAEIAALAGDDEAAAAYMRAACDTMEASGHTGHLSEYAPRLGRFLCALGRYDDAEPLAQQGRELAAPDDVAAQVSWRQTHALVHAARGQHAEAEQLAREAVAWAERSDSPVFLGDALYDLGEVLEAAGRRNEAVAAWQEALDRYERKGIVPLARRVRERLAALESA